MAKIKEIDTTPEIHYVNGIAEKVVTYCLHNNTFLAKSEVCLKDDGSFTEYHEDPEHGNWPGPELVSRSRLEQLAKHNPHCIPDHLVLGQKLENVDKLLKERKIKAIHKLF